MSSRRRTVAIVGGGFGGIGAAVTLSRAGHDVTVFEKADRVGGVWHHNTYPGAACDVPSHLYEFSFAPNPEWSRRFSPQAEIQAYIEDVARRFGVIDRVRTGTEVLAARWDEDRGRWALETGAGAHEAEILVTACGQLSTPKVPPLPGLESFEGPAFHTAEWRHDVDLEGKRVALVGTGCSAIQVGPAVQPQVERLDVYQRSPGWTVPKGDFAYSERAKRVFRRFPLVQRLDRQLVFASHDIGAHALTKYRWLLPLVRAASRRQIASAIDDPELRARVTPTDEVGCKRIMLTDDWHRTLAEDNVELIDRRVEAVTPGGVRAADGVERPADVLILATGFDSHAFVAPMEVSGRDGRTLAAEWSEIARAYLGLTVPGFPNMFLLYGPNTNGGTGSVIFTLEAGARHIVAALEALDERGAERIEVRPEAAERFDAELRERLAGTVWHTGCESWYVDENGNDPSQWPWSWSAYRRRTRELAPGAYSLQ